MSRSLSHAHAHRHRTSACGGGAEEYQHAQFIAILADEHDVVDVWRARCKHRRTHRSDIDPGAAGEFEILGDAAVETQSQVGLSRIDEHRGIAAAEETFVIEGLAADLGLAPVAGW